MQSALLLADELTPESVREMHRVLMADTNHTPGQWRREAVWIGTSARSPAGATFIAPSHERVPALMDDAMAFARRDDLPILAQVAVVHAQFETIHPFTDGNGRVGRALVQAMLRGKGITRSVIVPVSAGLLADIGAYHDALTAPNAYPTLRKLHELGILEKKREYKIGLVWCANDVLMSLDRFAERAGRRA